MMKIDWDQYKGDVEPETLNLFKSALEGEICFSFWFYFQAIRIFWKVLVRKQIDLPERLDGNVACLDAKFCWPSQVYVCLCTPMKLQVTKAEAQLSQKAPSSDEKLTVAIMKDYSLSRTIACYYQQCYLCSAT